MLGQLFLLVANEKSNEIVKTVKNAKFLQKFETKPNNRQKILFKAFIDRNEKITLLARCERIERKEEDGSKSMEVISWLPHPALLSK